MGASAQPGAVSVIGRRAPFQETVQEVLRETGARPMGRESDESWVIWSFLVCGYPVKDELTGRKMRALAISQMRGGRLTI